LRTASISWDWRARDGHVNDVVVFEVRKDSLRVIDFKRATDALRLLPWRHHEVFDEKLAASIEQLRQRHLALGPVKSVLLLHLHPR
jgi:hypothetical protein